LRAANPQPREIELRNRALILFSLLAAGLALVVAGCGGDDETSTSTSIVGATGTGGVTLTKEEFLAQANSICKQGSKAIDQAAEGLFSGQQPTDAEIEQFAQILVPGIQAQIDAVRALPAPEGDEETITTFLDESQSALDQVEADPPLLAASGDASPFTESNRLATEYGLTECAG
jgi:hypothetical protein